MPVCDLVTKFFVLLAFFIVYTNEDVYIAVVNVKLKFFLRETSNASIIFSASSPSIPRPSQILHPAPSSWNGHDDSIRDTRSPATRSLPYCRQWRGSRRKLPPCRGRRDVGTPGSTRPGAVRRAGRQVQRRHSTRAIVARGGERRRKVTAHRSPPNASQTVTITITQSPPNGRRGGRRHSRPRDATAWPSG